jgi:hypothetical protein
MNCLEGRLPEHHQRHLFEIQRKIASRVILEESYSTEAVVGVDSVFAGDLVFRSRNPRGYFSWIRGGAPRNRGYP